MLRLGLALATLAASLIVLGGCGCGGGQEGLSDEQIQKARERVKASENIRP